MGLPGREGIKLPRAIREELGIPREDGNNRKKSWFKEGNRNTQRKDERARRKGTHHPALKAKVIPGSASKEQSGRQYTSSLVAARRKAPQNEERREPRSHVGRERPISSTRGSGVKEVETEVSSPPPRRSKALVQDDAEIDALEKALGLKDKKAYPKVFEEEGLESLLGGLQDTKKKDVVSLGKRKRVHDSELENVGKLSSQRLRRAVFGQSPEVLEPSDLQSGEEEQLYSTDRSSDTTGSQGSPSTMVRERENPYQPPSTGEMQQLVTKYVPPSLRVSSADTTPDLSRLRRQLQGQLNRLSESNLLPIAREIENISKGVPRQSFFTSLSELIVERISDRSSLNDTFMILIAGFTATLCKVLGPEFAVLIITQLDSELQVFMSSERKQNSNDKQPLNILASFAQLYTFQIVGAQLIYDYIRLCINEISEQNTELLLRIIRIAGHQIRHDDSSALRDIVANLRKKIEMQDEQSLSIRTKFMLETIEDLKNNKSKHGASTATIASEHTIAMKKTLGTLNQRTLKMTEALGIGLQDIRNSNKQGRWWLVGASYQNSQLHDEEVRRNERSSRHETPLDDGDDFDVANDLALLARENRMNTDVRRAIFIAIMSSTDFDDANTRLRKLGLKRSQELEIPKVIIRCAASEKTFNPFYAALLTRTCTDRKLKMAIQFSIWDLFKQMGELSNDSDDSDNEGQKPSSKLTLREVVNLARTFGTVVGSGTQTLSFLKVLNLTYLQQHTRIFLEVLLTTMILQTQKGQEKGRNEAKLLKPVLESKELLEMASSLQYFIREVLGKSDIAGSSTERRTVKYGCRIICDALAALSQTMQ